MNQISYIFLLFLIFGISSATIVQINGILRCHNQTMKNATVELWEKDLLDPNDFLNRTNTDDEGIFEIIGEERETFGSIDPYLTILHKCSKDKKKNCQYRSVILLKLAEQNGTMKKEDFEANFGMEGDESKEENCSDYPLESEEMMAEKLAASNETENGEKNGNSKDEKKFDELPEGMAADLEPMAGTEMPVEEMNGNETMTTMGTVEEEEPAFNLTTNSANDENGNANETSTKQQQQGY